MTARVAVLGYATLEHSLVVADTMAPDRTAIVTERPAGPSGRVGGCAAYIATGLAAQGIDVVIATRVGTDAAGDDLVDALRAGGVQVAAIERRGSTPSVWMVYALDGDSWCIYDPAAGVHDPLTADQRVELGAAPWWVIAVGPYDATVSALNVLSPQQKLVWSVKADSRSWPAEVVTRLAARSDVVMLSERERDWVEANCGAPLDQLMRPGSLLVETRGRHGMRWFADGRTGTIAPIDVIDVTDTSGAGDWAVAGLVAALLEGAEPDAATRGAAESAARLLRTRTPADPSIERQPPS